MTLDQPFNVKVVITKRYGRALNLRTFTTEDLLNGMRDDLQSGEITACVKQASVMLRDNPQPPGQRALFWINHLRWCSFLRPGFNAIRR